MTVESTDGLDPLFRREVGLAEVRARVGELRGQLSALFGVRGLAAFRRATRVRLRTVEKIAARVEAYNKAVRLKLSMLANPHWRARVAEDLGGEAAMERWARAWERYREGVGARERDADLGGPGSGAGDRMTDDREDHAARTDRGRRFRLLAVPRPSLQGEGRVGVSGGTAARDEDKVMFWRIPVLPSELYPESAGDYDVEDPGAEAGTKDLDNSKITHPAGREPPRRIFPEPQSLHGHDPP